MRIGLELRLQSGIAEIIVGISDKVRLRFRLWSSRELEGKVRTRVYDLWLLSVHPPREFLYILFSHQPQSGFPPMAPTRTVTII